MKKMLGTTPGFKPVDPYKVLYNVGALMDIPTGSFIKGLKGENICNGGLGALVAVVGKPNVFKSTIAHFMVLSAASKIADSGYQPYINTYDTEMNIHPDRLRSFASRFSAFGDTDLIDSGIWNVTDTTKHIGNEWFKMLKDFLRTEKIKNQKNYVLETPFLSREGGPVKTIFPTFGEVDSLTKFTTADVEEMQNKNEIGDSGGNTIFMRSGLGKARLIMELPILSNSAAHYTIATAHVGLENMMGQQPHQAPTKKLQHMRQGEKIKGAPDDFFFLTNSLWQCTLSSLYNNQLTKGPEFPKYRDQPDEGSTDLNLVTLKLLRNKSGPSGYSMKLVVSQSEGVLASLSEFNFIKDEARFGLQGNNTTYQLVLLPEVNITRTTIRSLLDSNAELRRAVKITADLLQIKQLYKELPFEIPTMEQLYEKLGKEYDWKKLLATRDHWTFNQYEHAVPFLSSMDLLEMYHGLYRPFWYPTA